MLRIAILCMVILILLPTIAPVGSFAPIITPRLGLSLTGSAQAWAQTTGTGLMQQSDYKRRAAKKAKTEPADQQMAGVVPPEGDAGEGDYLVLGLLIASLVILAFLASNSRRIRLRL